jgi:hypothetical protein
MKLKYIIPLLSLATPLAAETNCLQDNNETPYEIISCLNNEIQQLKSELAKVKKNVDNIIETEREYKSCKEIKDAKPNSLDGIYTINPTGSNSFNVYCDMKTDGGGWMLFGVNGNNPLLSPSDFFSGYGKIQTTIDPYSSKKSWSLNLNALNLKSFELMTTIQTSTVSQNLKAESTQGTNYTNGIMLIPNKDYLLNNDSYLSSNYQGSFNIKHKCLHSQNWQRTLNYIDLDSNAKMQFTVTRMNNFHDDIWHWNANNAYYFRPQYNYCENSSSYNPGELVQVIFWIR